MLLEFDAERSDLFNLIVVISTQHQHHNWRRRQCDPARFWSFITYLIAFYRNFPDYTTLIEMGLFQGIVNVTDSVAGGTNGLIQLMAPMPESISWVSLSIWLCHNQFLLLSSPSDLVVDTCLTGILVDTCFDRNIMINSLFAQSHNTPLLPPPPPQNFA